ncbi:hypothetical protein BASA50_001108 [Batrachochytrium salamandrivorans]|uniref:Sm domain-containing protein n=1 Tax=Batrachochytrium salamandrivorans TaxID=1357716 RepID=A0ABQ8EUK5_9FUNG|nr:hypothetical protein BASA62_003585 [Batrachochytrium salamandrivorans]KAH6573358.1 hypothetical protein BASA60_006081 [Batrachochytrium salamandrivorans]KAH6580884.1 hypothetical protein BASA61_009339 [Batrachochytrium salamandrivorans]KAH6585499.1 hypothetical protein BASA50_001108 [Batrachochytrium salamandrivorans]KAH9265516.1 hypothetical protein BASA83_011112 [Batrachochytrium salamandrivorans]
MDQSGAQRAPGRGSERGSGNANGSGGSGGRGFSNSRGGGRGGRGQGQNRSGGGRGGHSSRDDRSSNSRSADKPKKENILDLAKYSNKKIIVQFQGGRQVAGILKGYDPLSNLVLDDAEEYIRDLSDPTILTKETRKIGLVVTRAPPMILISPFDGTEETEDPFSAAAAGDA